MYLQKAPKELIAQLAGLNATQSGNFPMLPEKPTYSVLTNSEKKRLNWGKPEAEKAVQVNHPNAYGLLHFSKPVFSPDNAKAVIYREFYIGDHGDGAVFYLEKAKGRWQFVEGMDVWRASW